MNHLGHQLRNAWPFKGIFTHTIRYEALPQPLSSANSDGGRQQASEKEPKVHNQRKWIAFACFFAGFMMASGIAVVLMLGVSDLVALDRDFEHHTKNLPALHSSRFTFTPNRAGVVLSTLPQGQRFSAVQANLTVPLWTPTQGRLESSREQAVSVWIGIDIDDETPKGVRTGLTLASLPGGETHLEASYEWGSDGPHAFTKLGPLSMGDSLQFEVVMANHSYAKAEIHNFSTGSKATKFFTQPPSPSETLLGQNVGWILEDPSSSGMDMVKSESFLDFGRIALEDCIVWTDKDEILSAIQGDMYRIRQDGIARTGVHIEEEAVYFTFIE